MNYSRVNTLKYRLEFRDGNGEHLNVQFPGGFPIWYYEDQLVPSGVAYLQPIPPPGLEQGWVRISTPANASESPSNQGPGIEGITGYAIFKQVVLGRPDFEAVVPLSGSYDRQILAVRNDGGYTSALAILNPYGTAGARYILTFRSENGGVVLTRTVSMGPRARLTFALNTPDYSSLNNFRGTLEITADSCCGQTPPVALGLLFNGSGPFTSTMPIQVPTSY